MTSQGFTDQTKEPQENLNSLPQWVQDFIQELMVRIQELEAQIAKNSTNSVKQPPISDGLKKPPKTRSQRGKSGRKPGRQNGHAGKTLQQVDNPDYIVSHSPLACEGCGHFLKEIEGASSNRTPHRSKNMPMLWRNFEGKIS